LKSHFQPPAGALTPGTCRRRVEVVAQAVLDRLVAALPARALRYLLASICERTGVSLVQVGGAQGAILGAAADRLGLGNYWRGLDPSAAVLAYLNRLFAAGGGTLIDVGANIGLFTIPLARNPLVNCKLFEPDPLNYRLLCWNLANNCPNGNIVTYQLALLDRRGTVDLERSPDNHGDHRVRLSNDAASRQSEQFGESARTTVAVAAAALDEVLEGSPLQAPVIVKIDTQGAEAHIVKGAASILRRTDVLVMEFWPYGMRRMGGPVADLLDALESQFSRGRILAERDWTAAATTITAESFRPIAAVIADLRKLDEDTNSVEQVDLVLCRDPQRTA
jgi:FkbM family methyltransferase